MRIKLKKKSALDLSGPIAFDCETTGLRVWKDDAPFAVGMCDQHGTTRYWDWPVDEYTRQVDYDSRVNDIQSILERPDAILVAHNGKFDVRMIERNMGIYLQTVPHETMFAMRVWNSLEPSLKLKPLAHKYLDYPMDDEKDLQRAVVSARHKGKKLGYAIATEATHGKEPVKADYWLPKCIDPENDLCEKYCLGDVERTIALHIVLQKKLQEEGLLETYEREMKLWPIVYQMEQRGVRLWTKCARMELALCKERMERDRKRLFAIAGHEFNPESDQQVAKIAFQDRGLVVDRMTDGGKPSTGWKSLIIHVTDPFIRALFDYRAASHGVGFFEQYLSLCTPDTLNPGGFVLRSSFEQSSALTGRFGSRQPNLQNVPTRDNPTGAEHPAARKPFGPRPGYVWYAFDYEQLELRIMAAVSQDESLLAAIASGRDIHSEVADTCWGGPSNPAALIAATNVLELERLATTERAIQDAWDKLGWTNDSSRSRVACEQAAREWLQSFDWSIVQGEASLGKKTSRSTAKTVIYAKMYGGGKTAVVSQLRCSLEEAKAHLDAINEQFPGIQQFSWKLQNYARNHGYIETEYGRRLRIDPNFAYKAINYRIQSPAADLIKESMIRCASYLRSTGLDAHMVLTVHDELVFEFKIGDNKLSVLRKLKEIMEDHEGRFDVPLPVECTRIVSSWVDKEKLCLEKSSVRVQKTLTMK